MKGMISLIAVMSISAVLVLGQAPHALKPGPEHQKLSAFVGNWTFEGEAKASPMGPAGKVTGTDRIQWLPGGFFLERRSEGKGPAGDMKALEIMGYDSAKKVYTYSYFDSMGAAGSGTMTVSGNTWNVTGTGSMGEKTLQERCALTFASGGTSLDVKCEGSTDGKTWTPTLEGKATKTKT